MFLEYDGAHATNASSSGGSVGGGSFTEMSDSVWDVLTGTCGSTYEKTAQADKVGDTLAEKVMAQAEKVQVAAAAGAGLVGAAPSPEDNAWEALADAEDDDIWALPPTVVIDDAGGDSFTW